ncbi:hypothetical protein BCY89_05745 [Sphingobacterium siyangense]|uniref:Uncharacterized protein n=1 Tax=Sphingobacterium siyangense TaxID=459529 RepID=A0A420FW92_9SPHI|nr:hypothetical protein [Sphingobacterium siyangense]RKF37154.1 hypothetical protein BCY89_05745 [Sphingobacterium siyangense]
MKNLRLQLEIVVIAIGSLAAISFIPTDRSAKPLLQEFYVNPDGTHGAQVTGQSNCLDESSHICSQEYNTTTNLPTGNPEKIHYFPRL